jgi:hypothetical protein
MSFGFESFSKKVPTQNIFFVGNFGTLSIGHAFTFSVVRTLWNSAPPRHFDPSAV